MLSVMYQLPVAWDEMQRKAISVPKLLRSRRKLSCWVRFQGDFLGSLGWAPTSA